MTVPVVESGDPTDLVNDALVAFAGCICQALSDICSCSLTIGETYVPFRPDEDDDCPEDEEICSQAWVRVGSIQPSPGAVEGWEGNCALSLDLVLEVGVLRCIEIPEDGEAPYAEDVLTAAMQSMSDMNTILCAALGCEVWASINVGTWTPMGPLGGQYGGTWTFTATLV